MVRSIDKFTVYAQQVLSNTHRGELSIQQFKAFALNLEYVNVLHMILLIILLLLQAPRCALISIPLLILIFSMEKLWIWCSLFLPPSALCNQNNDLQPYGMQLLVGFNRMLIAISNVSVV